MTTPLPPLPPDDELQPGDVVKASHAQLFKAFVVAAGDQAKDIADTAAAEAREAAALAVAPADTAVDAGIDRAVTAEKVLSPTAARQTYAPLGQTPAALSRWRRTLASDPANARAVVIGDSTALEANYATQFSRLRTVHALTGGRLAGMTPANIISGGNNGQTLASWLTDAAGPNGAAYSLADLIAADPDLVISSWLTNDVRLGATTLSQATALLLQFVDLVTDALPNADLALRVASTFTSTVVGTDFLGGATLAQAQERSDILRRAHLAVQDLRPNVVVIDSPAEVFGTVVTPTSPLMTDQIHFSSTGQTAIADLMAKSIGLVQDRALAHHPGAGRRYRRSGIVASAGNGFIDVGATLDTVSPEPASEWRPLPADTLYVVGSALAPLVLTGATFAPLGANLRILKSGTDFTGIAAGTPIAILGDHALEGVRAGAVSVSVDPPSLAAGATQDVTVAVPGATTLTPIIGQPTTGVPAGLLWQVYATGTDVVTIRFYNPTAVAIDFTNVAWRFSVAR